MIVYQFGYRFSIIAGGVIAAAGFAAATLAEQLFHLYFTIGIMSGRFSASENFIVIDFREWVKEKNVRA